MTFVAIGAIAALAFFVQGYTGFGAALVLAPLLALAIDLKVGVVASALVQVPIGIYLTLAVRSSVDQAALRSLVPASALGLIGGTLALAWLDVTWLARLCGILTALFALDVLRRAVTKASRRPWSPSLAAPAGLAGGLLGGLFGTSGPPIIAYLEPTLSRGGVLRATLLAYFLIINTLRVASYGFASLYTNEVLFAAVVMLPAAACGAWAGSWLQRRASEGRFRLIVAAVLFFTGLALAVR
ncbi:MAG: TSUP family transporter [Oscillochloridaceae bacterium umkhey_bin13]